MFFYIPYVIFETPWVIAVKRFGAGRVLAVAIVCWSAITIGTGFVHTYKQVIACRILLGASEAGLFPALTFVISSIYPAVSQGKRIAVLYISIALSGAVGGLIAYGIQSMGARHGLEAWRWLFIIEGVISLVIGAICWVSLPTSPETAWFLNEAERATMRLLKLRDHPFEVAEKFSWETIQFGLEGTTCLASVYCSVYLFDRHVWLQHFPAYASQRNEVSLLIFPFRFFLASSVHTSFLTVSSYTSLQANYLSIPVYVVASIGTGITTFVSDRIGRRAICLIHSPVLVIAGYAVAVASGNKSVGFFAMFLVGAGVYSYNTVLLTYVSDDSSLLQMPVS
jgi:MFS family permease